MGVRLYPNTNDVAKLEKLAGVPVGTTARLEVIQKRQEAEKAGIPLFDRYEIDYRHWQEINDDGDLGNLEAFMLYGWGKFRGGNGECSGSLEGAAAQALLDLNGIYASADYCEGVHWC